MSVLWPVEISANKYFFEFAPTFKIYVAGLKNLFVFFIESLNLRLKDRDYK